MLTSLLTRIRDKLSGRKNAPAYPLFVPHGHFYSPFPDLESINRQFKPDADLAGVQLREAGQLAFLDTIQKWYGELPFGDEPGQNGQGTRFGYNNLFFGHSDAITLYTVMREFAPRSIIEVGSGYSSAVMLDTQSRFLPDVSLCFIEPYPERLFLFFGRTSVARSFRNLFRTLLLRSFRCLRTAMSCSLIRPMSAKPAVTSMTCSFASFRILLPGFWSTYTMFFGLSTILWTG